MEITNVNTPKRRRLRISLRVLMLLVLVLGIWMGDRVNKAREQREAVAAVKKFRGFVVYDWEVAKGTKRGHPPAPGWLLRLLGDEYFQEVAQVILINNQTSKDWWAAGDVKYHPDRLLSCLKGQTKLKVLRFTGTEITIEGMKHLRKLAAIEHISILKTQELSDSGICHLEAMKNLTHVEITGSKLTDAGLAALARHSKLEPIDLRAASITDAGLAHLRHLKNLKGLHLRDTLVTDAGLEHLKGLTKLEAVSLGQTRITEEAQKNFKAAMPSLKIIE